MEATQAVNFSKYLSKSTKKYANVRHYTDGNALMKVLESKKIHFTDCQFLNDRSEYHYFSSPLRTAVSLLEEEARNPAFLRSYLEDIDNSLFDYQGIDLIPRKEGLGSFLELAQYRHYYFCTSVRTDSSSIWDQYGTERHSSGGYNFSLGIKDFINSLGLESFGYESRLYHGPVIYTPKKQVEIIVNEYKKLEGEFEHATQSAVDDYQQEIEDLAETYQESLKEFLDISRLFFKAPFHSSEEEYRFVFRDRVDDPNWHERGIGFKQRGGIVTPFKEVAFKPADCIKAIMPAPSLEYELAKKGLESYLRFRKLPAITIEQSAGDIR